MGVQQSGRLAPWVRSNKPDDQAVLRQMAPLMDELWRFMRYLGDLQYMWSRLSEEQRREIESSSVYRERFHEKSAQRCVQELMALSKKLRSYKYWRLRGLIVEFLDDWKNQEPDMLKVLIAMLKGQLEQEH